VAETAAQFRQECFALDHLVEELFRDVERLRDELLQKGDELDEGRRKLAERGRLLADQRKESGRLAHLVEQQETQLAEAITQIKSLGEQSAKEREEARERETARFEFAEQRLRSAEAERDQLRREVHAFQAAAAANGDQTLAVDSLTPLMAEFGDMRRQLSETQTQLGAATSQLADAIHQSAASMPQQSDPLPRLLAELGEMRLQLTETQQQVGDAKSQLADAIQHSSGSVAPTPDPLPTVLAELGEMRQQLGATQTQLADARTELSTAIERAAAAAAGAPPPVIVQNGDPSADEETRSRLSGLERERVELESELELVRTRATELQEVVNQQRRELVEQRADITTELRLLRELVEQRKARSAETFEPDEDAALVGASSRGEPLGSAPDPVVSSVMAQFARLQKDVAQRRKKK
jgi:chromosome segregation ATPase